MNRNFTFAFAWVGAMSVGCGGPLTYSLVGTPSAVGADGTLQATIHKEEHETKIVLEVKNLAPPPRISADGKFFVFWARRDANGTWQRVGNVVYDENGRNGMFKGSFPEVEFDSEVSVEPNDSPASPSSQIVFSQHVGPA